MLIFKSRINQANLRENLKKNILGSVSRFDWDLENNFERINIDNIFDLIITLIRNNKFQLFYFIFYLYIARTITVVIHRADKFNLFAKYEIFTIFTAVVS